MGWFKNKIKQWLNDGEEKSETPTSKVLDIVVAGQVLKAVAQTRLGMRLSCVVPGGKGETVYLVGEEQACDPAHFWRLWKEFGEVGEVVAWEEDGAAFDPLNVK